MKIPSAFRLGAMLVLLLGSFQVRAASLSDLDGFERAATEQGSTVLIPRGSSRTKRPALILLPFTGGSARDLLERWYFDSLPEQARDQGFIVVVPSAAGSAQDYATGSAWTATLERYTRNIAADARELATRFDADPARIALAGFSMGGDLGWALIQRDPELYAGAVVMGSRASYRAKGALERFAQRQGRVYFFLGSSESEVRRAGTIAALEALKRAGVNHQFGTAAGEHVTAPRGRFAEAVDYVLGYADGVSSPAAQARPAPAAAIRPAASRQIVDRLPGCDWEPYEDQSSGKSGYRNARGKIVVPPRFDLAEPFGEDGLAGILEKGKFGYISCAGNTFSVITYDNGPDRFSGGLARMREAGRIGFVNRRGEVVIPAQFEHAGEFCRGLARAGRDCSTEQRGEHSMTRCDSEFYIDQSGRTVPTPDHPATPPDCEEIVAQAVLEQLPACDWKPFREKSSGLYGYRDARGKTVVKPRFDVAREFGRNGVAPVREGNFNVGYLTCEGKFFDVLYEGGWDEFQNGLVRVERSGGFGYLNLRGETVIAARHSYGTPFCGGVAKVGEGCSYERDGDLRIRTVECLSWQYIGQNGREVPASRVKASCEDALTEPGAQDTDDGGEYADGESDDEEDSGDGANDAE